MAARNPPRIFSPGRLHNPTGSYHLCELNQSSTSFLAWSFAYP